LTSVAANFRIAGGSDYCTSKHTLLRLAEFVTIGECELTFAECNSVDRFLAENPSIRTYCIHPGIIPTELFIDTQAFVPVHDTLGLAAATILYLTSGKADFLSGRYVAATWDQGEVERDWKEKIVAGDLLKTKLSVPQ